MGHISFLKKSAQHSVVNVFLLVFLLDIILESTMTIGFQTFPNLITGRQKPQTMPWQACAFTSQSHSPFFPPLSSLSFHPYNLKLGIKNKSCALTGNTQNKFTAKKKEKQSCWRKKINLDCVQCKQKSSI